MFALAIYDTITPGELTGGRYIAGTGTITSDGTVGEIGGIQQKIAGAVGQGAEVFLVPAGDCAEAAQSAEADSVQLVKISTLDDAVKALEAIDAGDPSSVLPSCGARRHVHRSRSRRPQTDQDGTSCPTRRGRVDCGSRWSSRSSVTRRESDGTSPPGFSRWSATAELAGRARTARPSARSATATDRSFTPVEQETRSAPARWRSCSVGHLAAARSLVRWRWWSGWCFPPRWKSGPG